MEYRLKQFKPTFDLLKTDPYPVYKNYRELDPVHLGKPLFPEYPKSWYLFRYADVESVLRDKRFINDRSKTTDSSVCVKPFPERQVFWKTLEQSLLLADPPKHRNNRALVNSPFSLVSSKALVPFIRQAAESALDLAFQRDSIDLVADFAAPLPVVVIAKIMGLDIREHEVIRSWSRPIADAMSPEATAETYNGAMLQVNEFTQHLHDAFQRKKQEPGDDMISSLLAALAEDKLDEDVLISMCSQIMVAGQETTIDAIGNAILALIENSEQFEELRGNPSLVPNAAKELLRFNSSVQIAMVRFPTEDIEIGGKTIAQGEGVNAMLGAANHDPEQFENPEKLDIRRNFKGREVIFGHGIHRCLGAHLAQLELEVALDALLNRVKSIELKTKQLQWRKNLVFRGLTTLPVSIEYA